VSCRQDLLVEIFRVQSKLSVIERYPCSLSCGSRSLRVSVEVV